METVLNSHNWNLNDILSGINSKANLVEFPEKFNLSKGLKEGNVIVLPFLMGKINCVKLNNNKVISFQFSGCAMAKFDYRSEIYVAHICLMGPGERDDCREEWNLFIQQNNVTNISLFYPCSGSIYDMYVTTTLKVPDIDKGNLNVCGTIKGNEYMSSLIHMGKKQILNSAYHTPFTGAEAHISQDVTNENTVEAVKTVKTSCLIV